MSTARVNRTGHICGIPLLPLASSHEAFCWSCGIRIPLGVSQADCADQLRGAGTDDAGSTQHRFYPGRRNPLGWQGSHLMRGRNNDWDRRDQYTVHFWPKRMRRYRYMY